MACLKGEERAGKWGQKRLKGTVTSIFHAPRFSNQNSLLSFSTHFCLFLKYCPNIFGIISALDKLMCFERDLWTKPSFYILFSYPESLLFRQHGLFLLLCLLLQLVVAHGHDGQDQIDKVEGAEKDDHQEEEDVPGPGGAQNALWYFNKFLLHALPVGFWF